MKRYIGAVVVGGLIAACSQASDESVASTSEDLSSATIYDNGAINSPWYNNSWGTTANFNSTVVEYNSKHTASVVYNAWGALVLANGGSQIPAASYDTLTFYINGIANNNPSLAFQLFINNSTWSTSVSLAQYCGGKIPTNAWALCTVPIGSLGTNVSTFSEILIGENTGKNLTAIAYSTIVLSSSTGTDAGIDSPVDSHTSDNYVADTYIADTYVADNYVAQDSGTTSNIGYQPHLIRRAAFASEGNAALLTDGGYRSPNAWAFTNTCSIANPCWGAVNVQNDPAALLVDWAYSDGEGGFDTTRYNGNTINNYSLFVSADSTNGANGTWTIALDSNGNSVVVSNNKYTHRSHRIQFAGYSWVKIVITSSSANEIDELDLWDVSSTSADSYFFHGDSITQRCANGRGTSSGWQEQPSFQADINASLPLRYPLQIGGGIVAEGSSNAASEITNYLPGFSFVKHWYNVMGTNDLCGSVSNYSNNLQSWINSVNASGNTPVLVHPIWGNNIASYCSNNGQAFNAAVDSLVASNNLQPAVPLYEATVNHSEYFDANDVHPNPTGCNIWNQTFATYAMTH